MKTDTTPKSFSFLPKILYLLSAILSIVLPVIVLVTGISDTILFGIPFFIILAILFFLFWIEKLNRNFASDVSVIGLILAFLITLPIFIIGEGGLGIAIIIMVLDGLLLLGSFFWLIIAFIINKNYKTLLVVLVLVIFFFIIIFFSMKYLMSFSDKKFYEKGECDLIEYDKKLRDDCILDKVQVEVKDSEYGYRIGICDEIKDNLKKSRCKEIVSNRMGQFIYENIDKEGFPFGCEDIADDNLKSDCYLKISEK